MKQFHVGIKSIVLKNDKVLVLRSSERDMWEVPGGRIDADEAIEQTLVRELREEVPNVGNIEIRELLHAYRVPHDIKPDLSLVLLFYLVDAEVPSEVELSHEHTEFQWLDIESAIELVDESVKQSLRNYQQRYI